MSQLFIIVDSYIPLDLGDNNVIFKSANLSGTGRVMYCCYVPMSMVDRRQQRLPFWDVHDDAYEKSWSADSGWGRTAG